MNPYSPPGAQVGPQPAWGVPLARFVPLGWRVTLATIAIAGNCVMNFALDGTQLTFAQDLKASEPSLGPSLLLGAAALGLFVSLVLSVVFFSMFIHRAAVNVRALGRQGMEYTPGWCVGWFFIPFANLVRPYRAVSEVWRASDPDAGAGADWVGSPSVPGLFQMWWGTWLVSSILSNLSGRIDDPATSGAVGLAGSAVSVVAAVTCISIMNKLAARQTAANARAAVAAPPYP